MLHDETQSPISAKSTRDKILDAAEELFAFRGYSVSIRDIVRKADVELGVAHYHVGRKVDLLRLVMERRAGQHSRAILQSLDRAVAEAGDHPPSVEALIDALIAPVFFRLSGNDAGWRNYVQLISNMSGLSEEQAEIYPVHDNMDPVIQKFISLVRISLPSIPEKRLMWAFYFIHSAVIHIFQDRRTIDRLSGGLCTSSDFVSIRRYLIPFCAAGLYRLVTELPELPPYVPDA